MALVFIAGDVLGDKAPTGISTARVLNHRVHVDRKRIANAPNLDVLIERVSVAILGQNANVALTVGHLVLAGGVVGYIGIANVLDVPNDAVENLCHLDVGLVIDRDDLGLRAIEALLVGDLMDVLRQLVDRQARPRVDRLALHRPASCQHVGRPLPVVVGRSCVEPQVIKLVFARF